MGAGPVARAASPVVCLMYAALAMCLHYHARRERVRVQALR